MRDHDPLAITNFRGTFDRGEAESCPTGFFLSSQNVAFNKDSVATRKGIKKSLTLPNIVRQAVYKRIGEAQRQIILDDNGHLYDSTNLATPILTISAMTDFSMVTMFNRAYITPHNGDTGLPGQKVYVYEGSGTAQGAAGVAPTNTLTAVESNQSGNVESGLRVIAVAYETSSGFITIPGGFVTITSSGGFKIDLSTIEIGGPRIVARHILSTKRIIDFNGNFQDQTYFFALRIGNNNDVEAVLDFFDDDLQSDATYLLEQLEDIPAGVGIKSYKGKLIVIGENSNSSIARVSETGQPESFNAVEGFLTVNPGSGGGLKNCWEYRTQLYLQKSQQTYVTVDNGQTAAFWDCPNVDMSVGAECHSVAQSLDFGENFADQVVVGDRSGLRLFNGSFGGEAEENLTLNIKNIWDRINKNAFNKVQVVIDPLNFYIYATIPLDASTRANTVLFGNYVDGLTEDSIRWTIWDFPYEPTTIVVDVVNGVSVFKFGSFDDNVYEIDPTLLLDDNQAIDNWIEFPYFPQGDNLDDAIYNFTGIRMRIRGAGNLNVTMHDWDSAKTLTALQPILSVAPGKPIFQGFNFESEKCSIKLRLTDPSSWFVLTKFVLYLAEVWEDRPNT